MNAARMSILKSSMTKGKFTENCANQDSFIVNHKDNLTVKRVIVSIIYSDTI